MREPACIHAPAGCAYECRVGNPYACWTRARAIEQDPATAAEAFELDRRGCTLGLANACTNFAAATWVAHPDAAGYECARRIFVRSCEVGDHFACGMAGRLRVERNAGDDLARGRAELEQACEQLGGFACRVLALELERGLLDGGTPAQLQDLLAGACAHGDLGACGAHATVIETFTGE
ncbi:MAG: hypothetical protein K8W52_07635 [Deltaproteobacteria bacterium]|nr:hypothetical protein [Deltaproteobacteria bacterium]